MKLSYNKVSMPTPTSTSNSGDFVSDQFPAGLRVLVVDDDPTCLTILERMLHFCLYKVTKCNQAEEALSLLRENKNGFDIVLSDVHMPDMDGFKLLEYIGLEMDLPVIMMSVDDGKNVVMKGVKHGACDYLIKPVSIEALKNIWQHVVRKRKNVWKDLKKSHVFDEGDYREQKASDDADYSSSANEGKSSRKRRDEENEIDEKDDSSTSKKPRVVWSVELHQQFMAVVDQLGLDKAVPKKIMEMMNVPGLTRENVASHLQKYRMYLRRLSGVSHQQSIFNNSFMSPQEQHLRSIKPTNFLHGIPTNMEPKQFSNLHQSAQSFGSTSTRVNASAAPRSSPWLMQMAQSQPRVQMLNENTNSHATRFPSYLVQPTGPNGIANGVVGNGVADNSAAQRSSLMSFPMNQTTEISVSNFPHRCTPSISSIGTKVAFHAGASSESEGSGGFRPNYDIFTDVSHHANPLQGNIDVLPSILGHRGFSSIQPSGQNRDATLVGKSLISTSDAMSHGHLKNVVENSSRVKSQKVHDPSSEINPFFDQFDQEDLMNAYLKQHEGVGSVQKEFDFDGYSIDNIPVYNRSC